MNRYSPRCYWNTFSSKTIVLHVVLVLIILNQNNNNSVVHGWNIRERLQLLIGSSNPCYVRDRTQPAAESCEDIIIPTGFCEICGISTNIRVDRNGQYKNCLYTSGVETIDGTVNMACLDIMQKYVSMNPCDQERADGLRRYKNQLSLPNFARRLRTTSRQIVDSYVYGICELSCDCIDQYNVDINIRSYDVKRGNCQGHAHYDVCQIYPNIRRIRSEQSTRNSTTTTIDVSTIEPVCPYIADWRADHPGRWFDMTPTTVHPTVETFLHDLIDATELMTATNDTLWQQCFFVESSQLEIVPIQ